MTPAFAPGAAVRVAYRWPEDTGPAHVRAPHYLRGVRGEVQRCLGVFANPEDLAFGRAAPLVPLYHVRFAADALWPPPASGDLLVEVYEHWLEAIR